MCCWSRPPSRGSKKERRNGNAHGRPVGDHRGVRSSDFTAGALAAFLRRCRPLDRACHGTDRSVDARVVVLKFKTLFSDVSNDVLGLSLRRAPLCAGSAERESCAA
jgi:hypothetical protein